MSLTPFPDPLLNADVARAADRLHYAFGELLGVDDFRDEQTYHRSRLARTLFYLFGHGTVAGLRAVVEGRRRDPGNPEFDEVELKIQPGIAIDRAGRLIEIPRAWCLRLRRWYEYLAAGDPGTLNAAFSEDSAGSSQGSVNADILLSFHACDRGYTPAFATGAFDALDASQPSRIRDAHRLRLVPAGSETVSTAPATSPWTGVTAVNWREKVLDAWREPPSLPSTLRNPDDALRRDAEQTRLRIARLSIPAQRNTGGLPPTPVWSAMTWNSPEAHLDNLARDFVLAPAALQTLSIHD